MAKFIDRFTLLQVERLRIPGMYGDSDCLYLQVTGGGERRISKSWIFRYYLNGRRRYMGLGPVALVGLVEARQRALECRKQVLEGIDPIELRRTKQAQAVEAKQKTVTFRHCAERFLSSHKSAWKNAKHAAQWGATLEAYAYPVLGKMPACDIDTHHILRVLEPIWSTKPETASRVRGRIEVILDWARVQGFRKGENPARWRGHMDKLLPSKRKVKKVKHYAALPFSELPAFLVKLRKENGVAARALEFLILTLGRTGEVIGAVRSEIKNDVWIIPAHRMKAGKEHRVPLVPAAKAIAEKCMNGHNEPYVFPGGKAERPLSNMALLELLKRMGRGDLTAHGFRSTFKDWASETTDHSGEVTEMALAHTIENEVEAAYRRGDLFQKRIALMKDWASYCAGESTKTKASKKAGTSAKGEKALPSASSKRVRTKSPTLSEFANPDVGAAQ